ncbi:uncharacterized protein N7443_008259 [Penicillium atrosanguineum]|uniref:uncharacterized protein n=1 Tax=Penicillium atrosanguineum TaxID=1132637 RepID=UPI0023972BC5|nr:uncharacterized protein N7443_008259 [Penicillium atrosanguineum]KAJ5292306.1 hypothetical protein N7443_008259 [Penicillium atrosanguineum]
MRVHAFLLPLIALSVDAVKPYCPLLGPIFPPPRSLVNSPEIAAAKRQITLVIEDAISAGNLTDSISLQIFSGSDNDSIFRYSYSAPVTSSATMGVKKVSEDTVFRIGSGSKLWTMFMFLLETDGDVFTDPITKYVPSLSTTSNATRKFTGKIDHIQWDGVTVGELASHLAGIPRDYGFGDMAVTETALQKLEKMGFPVLQGSEIPPCGRESACSGANFINGMLESHPLVTTSWTPIYSNAAYEILGYALENVTGKSYRILLEEGLIEPLGLTRSSYSKPDDKYGVIPGTWTENYWNVTVGDETPAGGLYSSAKDMAAVGRAILKHTLLTAAETRRWMKPSSHTASLDASIGHPWEILSLSEPRVIDLYTKSGDLGWYSSMLALSPDHNAGFTILSAGETSTATVTLLSDQITDVLIPALEAAAKSQAQKRFAGTYSLGGSNITISSEEEAPGLKVSAWNLASNNMFDTIASLKSSDPSSIDIRLYPSGIEVPGQIGFQAVIQSLPATKSTGLFSGACITWETNDALVYGHVGLDSFLFNVNREGQAVSVVPRALRLSLPRL